ncbi:uncharacterized protein SCHCODRAFT_02012930 [Schizophyllum commune H4-8]|uniref:uncharacterized protein n=1 Tax=Schizophyllum commune (strain H4-8 / FGSC 9210) TaxID=578458 RepID=UPI002160B897|nr:uncharacterized protein SCHCODRAFT_02012930 [Schizophyllum commune H4-8]KAI5899499.1 hypothetical protein SCHCODRAFT_02012930 [Schizophyllum commune H4-8]
MRIQCLSVRPPAGFIMRNYIALTTKWNFGARVSCTHSQSTTHSDAKRHRQRLQRLLSNLELSQPLPRRGFSSAFHYSCCIPLIIPGRRPRQLTMTNSALLIQTARGGSLGLIPPFRSLFHSLHSQVHPPTPKSTPSGSYCAVWTPIGVLTCGRV